MHEKCIYCDTLGGYFEVPLLRFSTESNLSIEHYHFENGRNMIQLRFIYNLLSQNLIEMTKAKYHFKNTYVRFFHSFCNKIMLQIIMT